MIRAGDPWIAQLADAFAEQWPEWVAKVGRAHVEASFVSARGSELPRVWVAHRDGEAFGTVALRPWFGESPMPQTPWIRGFYVKPKHRGRGVDRHLLRALEADAASLGFHRLYAATTAIKTLAVRRGWQVFHRLMHDSQPMAWMYRDIHAA